MQSCCCRNRHNIFIMDELISETQNQKRIREVDNAFSRLGVPLSVPGRVLKGEGVLMKQGRKKWEQKVFFLFSDILVYGSIVVNNVWFKKKKVLPLQDIMLEDTEDFEDSKHQWLICTSRKSFFVSATSYEEKKAWMEHIKACHSSLLQDEALQPKGTFAKSWIPDHAAQKCMRCLTTFTATRRRHHCRNCGFVVCNNCSKGRALIEHIDPSKRLRICKICDKSVKEDMNSRIRGGSDGFKEAEEISSDDE